MKKWIIIVCLFLLVIATILYFLIPANKNTGYKVMVNCTESGASRKIINKENWQLWWPGQKINDTLYTYQSRTYKIDKILLNGIQTTIFNNKDSVKAVLQVLFYGNDSTQFQWMFNNINYSANPLIRFKQYFAVRKCSKNIVLLLENMKKYFDNPENIYGLKITRQRVAEASMISLKDTFQQYPSTQEIYGMIQSVKGYIQKKGGEESGHPMLHVEKEGPAIFEVMVAVPTKKDLPSEGQFELKHMHLGFILTADVKGGAYSIVKGEEELTNYFRDYKKNSPAISFQSLVTDRLTETDSTKWVTRLYYPVFQ